MTLTVASKLGPHLTAENATSLLARAVHATRRQVEVLVAELAPRPDVWSSLRRLPAPRPTASVAEVRSAAESPPADAAVTAVEVRPAGPVASPAKVVAIAPARFRVQFTASAELEEKIQRARALLRHTIPSGDVAAIIDEAMTVLVGKLERRRCGATQRPRTGAPAASTTRDVPAAARRAVWQRDESRCTFVDRQGRRCEARDWLEIHHDEPFGRGGETRVENLRLFCRSHNQFQAEIDYGANFMQAKRRPP
jgi:hypothetical protein